jgi:ABC-2 type transport system permease protein
MDKTFTILRHEFLKTVKTRSFIILTLAFPTIAFLLIFFFGILSGDDDPPPEPLSVGYVDNVGIFNEYREQFFVNLISFEMVDEATDSLLSGQIDEFFIIPEDYLDKGQVSRFTLNREIEPPGEIPPAIKNFLLGNLIGNQVTPDELKRVQNPLNILSTTLDETGKISEEQGGFGIFLVPYIFGILLMMAIFTSSGYMLQGLGEEKENRIMEILLSSVSSRQLITGKVLGLGAAGLTQILFWIISAQYLLNLSSQAIGGVFSDISLSTDFLFLAPIYFILGYLLFAILMAGLGAVAGNAREGQQMAIIFTLPAAIPFMLQYYLIENPSGIVSQLLTIFPITAPVATIIRLGSSEIPGWQLALSMTVMIASIVGALYFSSKIFRTFLLLYGKTATAKEIWRALRQA